MNANNLADEFVLDNLDWNEDIIRDWGEQAVTMLRHQQAEIEALKKQSKSEPNNKVNFELTDEEICKIFNEHTGLGIHQKEADKADLLVFARAILRKAQEK